MKLKALFAPGVHGRYDRGVYRRMLAQKRQALGQISLPNRRQSWSHQKTAELIHIRRTLAPTCPKLRNEHRIGIALQRN